MATTAHSKQLTGVRAMLSRFRQFVLCLFMLVPAWATAQTVGTVRFDFDVDTLDAKAQAQVVEIAEALQATDSYKPTVVVGYTDAVGSSGYNYDLGLRRARNVAAALEALGVPVDRIGDVSSRGETDLVVAVAGPQRANRRVTVTLGDIMGACRSYRSIPIADNAGNSADLQRDLQKRLKAAVALYATLSTTGRNGPAFQMAGATQDDCSQAVGFDGSSLRKVEYAKRCFCSYARMQTAQQGLPSQ